MITPATMTPTRSPIFCSAHAPVSHTQRTDYNPGHLQRLMTNHRKTLTWLKLSLQRWKMVWQTKPNHSRTNRSSDYR